MLHSTTDRRGPDLHISRFQQSSVRAAGRGEAAAITPPARASTSNDPAGLGQLFSCARFGDSGPAGPTHASPPFWPLAAQPGRVIVSMRSDAFYDRCATEHWRPREPGESTNVLVRRAVWTHEERRTRRPYCWPPVRPSRLNPRTTTAFPLVRGGFGGPGRT
jgi:hypothetical protein